MTSERGSSWVSRLESFLSLGPGDQFRLVTATCLLLGIWGGVRIIPFNRLRGLLVTVEALSQKLMPGTPAAERLARTVEVADTHVPGERTCLVRSLTVEVLLTAHNYPFTHRIGVDNSPEGEFGAHSWIEYDGEILIGRLEDIDRFEPLPPLKSNE